MTLIGNRTCDQLIVNGIDLLNVHNGVNINIVNYYNFSTASLKNCKCHSQEDFMAHLGFCKVDISSSMPKTIPKAPN